MRKLFPIILALVGLVAGGGAGYFLRPSAEAGGHEAAGHEAGGHEAESAAVTEGHEAAPNEGEASAEAEFDYVKLSNQFVIPVVEDGKVSSMVILALSLEVTKGSSEAIFAKEPKFRDMFLQVLFDHANAGGFRGSFTDGANLVMLRKSLLEAAKSIMPDVVSDVLIADIARQDS